jgi:hypothetical protein
MKNIKENIIKNRIVIYVAIEVILLQVIGVIVFKKYNAPGLKYLFITTDIASIAAFLSLFTGRILNIKSKILEYTLNGISVLFLLLSFAFFYKK